MTHGAEKGQDWYDWQAQIHRTMVIGDRVFTMSEKGIKASALGGLSDLGWVSF